MKIRNSILSKVGLIVLLIVGVAAPIVTYVLGADSIEVINSSDGVKISLSGLATGNKYTIIRTSEDEMKTIVTDMDPTTITSDKTVVDGIVYNYSVVNTTAPDVILASKNIKADINKPQLPTSADITVVGVGPSFVDLKWNASPSTDVWYYEIYRDGVKVGSSKSTSFRDFYGDIVDKRQGLTPNTDYTYTIKVIDQSGNVSDGSYTAEMVTTLPSDDTEYKVKQDGNFADQWSETIGSVTLGGAAIFRAEDEHNAISQIQLNKPFTISNDELVEGQLDGTKLSFNYQCDFSDGALPLNKPTLEVEYKQDNGEWTQAIEPTVVQLDKFKKTVTANLPYVSGEYLLRITVDGLIPDSTDGSYVQVAVSNLQVKMKVANQGPKASSDSPVVSASPSSTGKSVSLSWDAYSDNNLAGYRVYRTVKKADAGDTETKETIREYVGSTKTNNFTDRIFPISKTFERKFTYEVEAIDDQGFIGNKAAFSKEITVPIVSEDTTPPDELTVTGVAQGNAVELSWTSKATEAESDIVKYVVFKKGPSDTAYYAYKSTAYSSLQDTEVFKDKTYKYIVVAVDSSGLIGKPSAVLTVNAGAIDNQPPDAVTGIKVVSKSDHSISLVWEKSAAPDLKEYVVSYKNSKGVSKDVKTPTNSTILTKLIQEEAYEISVAAVDTSGNKSSVATITVTTDVDDTAPTVVSRNPGPNATRIGTKENIKVVFSDAMDWTTVKAESFVMEKVLSDGKTEVVLGSFTTKDEFEVWFKPKTILAVDSTYQVTLKKDSIKNLKTAKGTSIGLVQDVIWKFTTYSSGEDGLNKGFVSPHRQYTQDTNMCSTCHSSHNAKLSTGLVSNDDMNGLCLQCHDGSGSNKIINESSGGSHSAMGDQSCSSCHYSHESDVESPTLNMLKVNKPSTTSVSTLSLGQSEVDPNQFCFNCHGDQGLGSKGYLGNEYMGDHQTFFPTNGKGHNSEKMAHYMSANVNNKEIQCLTCHERHGSTVNPLLRTDISYDNKGPVKTDVKSNSKEYCYQCHENPVDFQYSGWAQETWQNDYDGREVNEKSGHGQFDCQTCHNSHGTQYPNYLRMNFASGDSSGIVGDVNKDAEICLDCHDINKLKTTGPVSNGQNVHNSHGNITTCKTCHSVHGAGDSGSGSSSSSGSGESALHKVQFHIRGDVTTSSYTRNDNTASCDVSCHKISGIRSVSGLRSLRNPTWAELNRSLKDGWQDSSKLLSQRRSILGKFDYRDPNNDGFMYK